MAQSAGKPLQASRSLAPKLLIFDFDGTIADTWPWMARQLRDGAVRHGYRRMTLSEIEALRSLPTEQVFAALEISSTLLPAVTADIRRAAEQAGRFPLFAGATEVIAELHRRGYVLAIVSSNTENVVRASLRESVALFSSMRCATSVFDKSRVFQEVVDLSGAHARDVLTIGDETRDVEAAREIGIAVLAVEWGYAAPDTLRAMAPGRTVGAIAELVDAIEALLSTP